ncbi:MAG: hypothetical protein K2P51_08105 [Rhabdochlamydiaceae bacterium]|nr:hypothetical protein [Rhabdochlamydiaceae bacterium]
MRKKTLAFLVLIIAIAIGIFTCWKFYFPHYSSIPVIFNSAKIPLIRTTIQGEEHFLEMDLGSKFQISLHPDILAKLTKEPEGVLTGKDMNGNSYSSNAFLLKRVLVGSRQFNDVVVKEISKEFISNTTIFVNKARSENKKICVSGSIGRPLLTKTNLLLDFPNSKIHFCDDPNLLKKTGFNIENWSEADFEIGRTGVVIKVETDLGQIRLSLDTGTTLTMLRESSYSIDPPTGQAYGLPYFTSSKFHIGTKDFGNVSIYFYKITPEVQETDGILGMDFLQSHPVYLDYRSQKIYIGN